MKIIPKWWHHQMKTSSALLAFGEGNSPAIGEFRSQRPMTRSFDVFFDLCPNKQLSKKSWGWWFETTSRSLRKLFLINYRVTTCQCITSRPAHCKWPYYILEHRLGEWYHDDVIKWKHFPRNWPFVRGIDRSRWIPHTKASDAELWCFLLSASD